MGQVVRDQGVSAKELTIYITIVLIQPWLWTAVIGWIEPGAGADVARAWYVQIALGIIVVPALLAVVLAGAMRGRSAVKDLLSRVIRWRVSWIWYAITLLLPPLYFALTALLSTLHWPVQAFTTPLAPVLQAWLAGIPFLTILIVFEELGWRGYLLPALQARMSALKSSLAVGLVWAAWHYPVWAGVSWAMTGSVGQVAVDVAMGTVALLALSVIFMWVFNGSGGSVLLVMLLHGSNNQAMSAITNAMGGLEALEVFPPLFLEKELALVGLPIAAALVLWKRREFLERPISP